MCTGRSNLCSCQRPRPGESTARVIVARCASAEQPKLTGNQLFFDLLMLSTDSFGFLEERTMHSLARICNEKSASVYESVGLSGGLTGSPSLEMVKRRPSTWVGLCRPDSLQRSFRGVVARLAADVRHGKSCRDVPGGHELAHGGDPMAEREKIKPCWLPRKTGLRLGSWNAGRNSRRFFLLISGNTPSSSFKLSGCPQNSMPN